MALELCEYGSARDLFARAGFRPVPETVIAPITRGLVAAVQYLHDRVVMHRDIKAGACSSESRRVDSPRQGTYSSLGLAALSSVRGSIF